MFNKDTPLDILHNLSNVLLQNHFRKDVYVKYKKPSKSLRYT